MFEADMRRPAIRAAVEIAESYGIIPDRCVVLQDLSTLVLRLSEDLVARIVQDADGPRKGTAWFARENAVAAHMTVRNAPVIPLHPGLPPGPHERGGYPINFWKFVTRVPDAPEPAEVGRTLYQCHEILRDFAGPLSPLAILQETFGVLDTLEKRALLPGESIAMLRSRLASSMDALGKFPQQPLHGDAHMGNLMNTTEGLLWTDWEDTFLGPVEWDIASIIWNAKILENNETIAGGIIAAYVEAGGSVDECALHHGIIARGAVMTAWYPLLYPNPDPERKRRLEFRLKWLEGVC